MNVGFVSLGCSKNLVDTEMCIGLFKENKYKIVNNPQKADIIIINTCGFIDSAKEEGINTILEMAEYKKQRCKYLIVMGCLVQRYKKDLEKLIPEVDLWISIDEYDKLWKTINNLINNPQSDNKELDYMKREITTGRNMAYLKIAEGCSNKCTYCAIPYIRGPFISRKMEDIIKEANQLAVNGIKEIVIIAQDTTKYGIDIYGKSKLSQLLEEISKIEGIEWIRFLYAYPETITDELIEIVKNNDKICKYFDIPIQHISNRVLKRMNRKSDGETIRSLIKTIRREIPNVVIRTTLIVGFPGETNEDFEELYQFVEDAKFDKLGAFMYSKEEGTPAARLPEQIHHMTKKSRYNKIMSLQKDISEELQKQKVGNTYKVLIETTTFDNKFYIGRSYMDVPSEDGVIYMENNSNTNLIGEFVNVKITDYKEYDLIGKII